MGDVAAQKANIWVNSGYPQMRLCALPPSTICLHAGWGGIKHASALYFGRRIGTTPHLRHNRRLFEPLHISPGPTTTTVYIDL